jgi:hypothetical protein
VLHWLGDVEKLFIQNMKSAGFSSFPGNRGDVLVFGRHFLKVKCQCIQFHCNSSKIAVESIGTCTGE